MSKLRPYLADIASAIREKKGSSEPINAKDFSNEIRSIQSGAAPVVEEKDICFYDYDGTLLFSYTIEEAQALTELPTPKGHEGLVFQGWNWDYEDVIALDYPMDIGALYVTDDGATRLHIEVTYPMQVPIYFSQSISMGVVVDWGDGSPIESIEGTTDVTLSHNYEKGNYCISLLPTDGCTLYVGVYNNNTNHNVFGLFYNVQNFGKSGLKRVHFGINAKCRKKCFSDCYNLKYLTFAADTVPADNMLYGNIVIECLIYSQYSANNFFSFCRKVCFPQKFVHIENSVLNNRLLAGMATGRYLTKVILPDSINRIVTNACRDTNVAYLRMPKKLETIDLYSCDGLISLKVWDFRACEQVPTNAQTNKGNITAECKVVVPDALYDEWISATNWAAMADQIIKASEYVEQ